MKKLSKQKILLIAFLLIGNLTVLSQDSCKIDYTQEQKKKILFKLMEGSICFKERDSLYGEIDSLRKSINEYISISKEFKSIMFQKEEMSNLKTTMLESNISSLKKENKILKISIGTAVTLFIAKEIISLFVK